MEILNSDVSSDRSSSDLSKYSLFQIQKYFVIFKNKFLGEKRKIVGLFFVVKKLSET